MANSSEELSKFVFFFDFDHFFFFFFFFFIFIIFFFFFFSFSILILSFFFFQSFFAIVNTLATIDSQKSLASKKDPILLSYVQYRFSNPPSSTKNIFEQIFKFWNKAIDDSNSACTHLEQFSWFFFDLSIKR